MKTSVKALLFTFLPLAIFGQTTVINRSLQKQRQDSAYLYVGATNYLQIVSPSKTNTLQLRVNGKLLYKTDSTFTYETSKPGFDTAQVFMGNKLLATTIFKTNTIKVPQVFVANTMAETMTKNRLLVNPFISIKIPDCYYDITYFVFSFGCIINDKYFPHSNGSYLTNEMIAEIKKLHSGDQVQFIRIKGEAGVHSITAEWDLKTIKIE